MQSSTAVSEVNLSRTDHLTTPEFMSMMLGRLSHNALPDPVGLQATMQSYSHGYYAIK